MERIDGKIGAMAAATAAGWKNAGSRNAYFLLSYLLAGGLLMPGWHINNDWARSSWLSGEKVLRVWRARASALYKAPGISYNRRRTSRYVSASMERTTVEGAIPVTGSLTRVHARVPVYSVAAIEKTF